MNELCFVGRSGLGGASMRGQSVAKALNVPFIDIRKFDARRKYDTIVLVKYWIGKGSVLRKSCERLIFDPLDCWSGFTNCANWHPRQFFQWCYKQLVFDDLIVCTPSAVEILRDPDGRLALPGVATHCLPHHADPRVGPDWYDPSGPVVYAGGLRFIKSEQVEIQRACERLGRKFVIDTTKNCWRSLQGSSLALHLRLPPHDTLLNRWCKPQVKLENAAAAGLPVLATPDPCVLSLRPEVLGLSRLDWKTRIDVALNSSCLERPVTLEEYCECVLAIL